ncbi:MAG: NFACT RNA binding domain-containing protein [Bacteroidota bacterium]
MFHNYFFLKRLAQALDSKLEGLSLEACFSQNKDELILIFGGENRRWIIRANLDPSISLLEFPTDFSRTNKNSIDLFPSLLKQSIERVETFRFERSFCLHFSNGQQLIFKLHSRKSNLILAQENRVFSIFRNRLAQDLALIPTDLHNQIEISEEALQHHNYDPISLLPALGKEVKIFLSHRGYFEAKPKEQWILFQEVLSLLDKNPISLLASSSPQISLLQTGSQHTDDPIYATNWLYQETVRKVFFEREKETFIQKLKGSIKKSENYIEKNQARLAEMRNSRNPEEIANIIMANLHKIQQGLSKVVLTDFYSNAPITIKLNTKLSPQKNAETYYRKSKNRHKEIDILKSNIREKDRLIDQLSARILELDAIQDRKELKKFAKAKGLEKERKKKEKPEPYHLFELDGWQVLVGKNSKANDELTLKVAKKNDLWLHVKDVPGSHVVIRQKPGQNYPKHIIEFGASLAAAYSKRKGDSMAPVIFTPKKFVRKVKGTPAGQVIVEKEEVLMIEPKRLS